MVFTEEQLDLDPLKVLDEAIYLAANEASHKAITVPVCENQRLNTYTVYSEDVFGLAEENGISYFDALNAIAKTHDLLPSNLTVVINEADVVDDPEIVNEFENIAIAPISDFDPVYVFIEAAIDTYADTEDEAIIDFIVNEANMGQEFYRTMLRHMASDAGKMDRNPIKAYEGVKNLGPMYARWGWDQNPLVRNIAFFKHPVVQAILGHNGSGGIDKYKSAIMSFAKAAGDTPEEAKANVIARFEKAVKGMKYAALDPLEGRYSSPFMKGYNLKKPKEWADKLGSVIAKFHPSNNADTTSSSNSTSIGSKIGSTISKITGSSNSSGSGSSSSSKSVFSLLPSLSSKTSSSSNSNFGQSIGSKISSAIENLTGSNSNHTNGGNSNKTGIGAMVSSLVSGGSKSASHTKSNGSDNHNIPLPAEGSHTLRNLGIIGAGAVGAYGLYKGIQSYRNKPKSIIGRKVAALRKVYQKYLEQARKYPEKAGIFKKIASKILGAIDQLLGFLQRKAG